MSVTSRLIDEQGRPIDSVRNRKRRGLLVATMPSREMSFYDVPFMTNIGSIEMAINGSTASGVELSIWDGTGALDTGADWILTDDYGGSIESAAAMHAGTNGLDTGVATDDDKVVLDNGVSISIGTYQTLSLWLYTQSRGLDSDIELEWRDAADNGVGSKLKVGNYITWSVGSWVLVSIPIVDFGVSGSVRYLRVKFKKSNQQHYIDEIALQTAGGAAQGPTIYRVEPPRGKELEIHRLLVTIVANKTGWLHGDFADIDGGLAAGFLFRWWEPFTGVTMFSGTARDNLDLFSRMSLLSNVTFFDTGQLVTLEFGMRHAPLRLDESQALDFVVRDDLSTLLRMQARAQGAIGRISPDLDGEQMLDTEL